MHDLNQLEPKFIWSVGFGFTKLEFANTYLMPGMVRAFVGLWLYGIFFCHLVSQIIRGEVEGKADLGGGLFRNPD